MKNGVAPLCLLVFAFALPAFAAEAQPSADLEVRRKALNDLLHEQWEYTLRINPVFASIIGDKRYNDQVGDPSEKATLADLEESRKFLARFEAIDTAGFPEQEALNKELMVRDLREEIEGARFKNWRMPVNQFLGFHIQAPQLVSLFPFTTVKDYDDYVKRLRQFPKVFDDVMDNMRAGMGDGLMPPKFLLEKVAKQSAGIAALQPEQSPFAGCLAKLPASFPVEEQERIRKDVLAAVRDHVIPAYQKFTEFVAEEYAPKGRTEVGVWSLPEGEARYAFRVKQMTTTGKTPEEIHRLGLEQVAEIENQMLVIARKLGYQDLKSFNAAQEENQNLRPKSRQEIVDLYQKHTDFMYTHIPKLFGRLPKAKMEIKAVEEFREKEASGAQYFRPAADGSRPGIVRVNTGDFAKRKTIGIESTAYHEGVPGHHMQLAIQQELPTLPPFRQQGGFTAFIEGWALYSERLGREVGAFQDPYSMYGHLQEEMWRAIRLVVDTGLHHKRWTREQVVAYMREHSNADEPDIQSEADRYIAWPGQALAYKIGQLKILELRERAAKKLGQRFDIRAFHDEVLGAGALPLDTLEKRIDGWIERQKSQPAAATAAK